MSRESAVTSSDSLRVIFIFWFRWLSIPRCAQETPNDPSSTTRPTERVDYEPRRYAGFAEAPSFLTLFSTPIA